MWPYLLGTALAAAWLTCSRLHRLQNCDSLVFSLASLYEWTPFFWEQDRVGLLLPLLVMPVRDPFANLLVLTGVMSFCGLAAPLLMARLVCPHPAAYAAVTVGNALMVALGPAVLVENLYVTCVYPLALCLGLPAVMLLDRPTWGRGLLAVGLLVVAHWVYLGLAVFLVPLAGARWLVAPSWATWWAAVRAGLATAIALGVMLLAGREWRRRHPEIMNTPSSGLPVVDWPECWAAFFQELARHDGFWPWAAAVGVVAGVGFLVGRGRHTRGELAAVLPLAAAAAAELLVLGTRAWPAQNQHHPRYLLAGVPAVWAAALMAAWVPAVRDRVRPGWLAAVSFAVLAGAIGGRLGPPSPAAARAELDGTLGRDTADLFASGAEGFGGEYMAVWPTVWHARFTHPDRPVVGVTSKALPWAERWQTGELRDGFRLAAPFDQEEAARRWLAHYGLTVTAGPEPFGRLIVFTVRPAG